MNARALRPLSLLLLLAAACDNPAAGGEPGAPAPQKPLATVQVSPADAEIVEGWMTQLEVAFLAADGTVLPPRPAAWTSSDTTVAVVSAEGTVRARRPGRAVIAAAAEGKEGRAEIEVEARRPTAIRTDRAEVGVGFRETAYVSATVTAQDGQRIDVPVTWTTSDSSVVAVDGGRLTGMGAGAASVKARVGDLVAEVRVVSAGPVLSGSWTLVVAALEGAGSVCRVDGVHLGLLVQDGQVQGGSQAWSNPRVECSPVGGGTQATTPFPPASAVSGRLTGSALQLSFAQPGWYLSGEFTSADRIEGTVVYRELVDGAQVTRTGRFRLQRG